MATNISTTSIYGVWELVSDSFYDDRGAFLNAYRSQEPSFNKVWAEKRISQVNLSRTQQLGTVRGLHLQKHPYCEAKIIRCIRGRVWDVAVDLRLGSVTWGTWHSLELTPSAGNALLIPEGCAHGFQVLEPGSELLYLHTGEWIPHSESGVHCCDPDLAISWPQPPRGLSDRDKALPSLRNFHP